MIKKKELSPDLKKNVFERPSYLDGMTRGIRTRQCFKLAEQIRNISDKDCVKYELTEFQQMFKVNGNLKQAISNINQVLKNQCGIKKPRVVFDDGKVFCWENRLS